MKGLQLQSTTCSACEEKQNTNSANSNSRYKGQYFSDWSRWTLKVTHDVNSKWTVPVYIEIEIKYLQWALSNSETVMMSFSLIGKIEFLSKVQKELHL